MKDGFHKIKGPTRPVRAAWKHFQSSLRDSSWLRLCPPALKRWAILKKSLWDSSFASGLHGSGVGGGAHPATAPGAPAFSRLWALAASRTPEKLGGLKPSKTWRSAKAWAVRALVLAGLGLALAGCASSDVNPAQARAQTGYVDLYAGSPRQHSWEVSRFDERARDFEHLFSDFDPPQNGSVRLALAPGSYRLKVAILNRLTTGPVEFQVRVEDGKITPVRFTLKRAGTGEAETEETNVGDTLYGRYGRNTRFSDVQYAEYAVSAAVEIAVAYRVKAEMPLCALDPGDCDEDCQH